MLGICVRLKQTLLGATMFIAKEDSYLELVGSVKGLPDHISVKFNDVTGDTVNKLFTTL